MQIKRVFEGAASIPPQPIEELQQHSELLVKSCFETQASTKPSVSPPNCNPLWLETSDQACDARSHWVMWRWESGPFLHIENMVEEVNCDKNLSYKGRDLSWANLNSVDACFGYSRWNPFPCLTGSARSHLDWSSSVGSWEFNFSPERIKLALMSLSVAMNTFLEESPAQVVRFRDSVV